MSNNPLSPKDSSTGKLKPPSQTLLAAPAEAEPAGGAVQRSSTSGGKNALDGPVTNDAAKQEFLWHVHDYLGEYARFADTKAAFAGAIASALIGALYSARAFVPIVKLNHVAWSLPTRLAAGAGIFLLISVILAIASVLPRGLHGAPSKGFIFWRSIVAHEKSELLRHSFHLQSARTLNDELLNQIFTVSSRVCVPKYRCVAFCIWALAVGGLLAAMALVLQG